MIVPESANSTEKTRSSPGSGSGRLFRFSWLLLVLTKGAKFTKIILAVLSLIYYSWMFTWPVAVVFMLGLVCHEYGHVWAMRRCGIPTKGFYLIPFVGGICSPERPWDKRGEEAFIAAMGPVWGLASTPVCFLLGYIVSGSSEIAAHATELMVGVNLFNLLPIVPMDGGRILRAVVSSFSPKLGFCLIIAGLFATAYFVLVFHIYIFILIALFAVVEAVNEYFAGKGMKAMTTGHALAWLAGWLGLVAACVFILAGISVMTGDRSLIELLINI